MNPPRYQITQHHVPASHSFDQAIHDLKPALDAGYMITIVRGGITLIAQGTYRPCSHCDRPATAPPTSTCLHCKGDR
jgi:hypothetical protein